MPLIDCPDCHGRCDVLYFYEPFLAACQCRKCNGTGQVPDDFFPEDSAELRDPDEEPEEITDG